MKQKFILGAAIAAFAMLFTGQAFGAAIGFSGTGGFIVDGNIANLAGTCAAGCAGAANFNTGALLADGLVVTGTVGEFIQEDGLGDTTSAFLRVTNLTAVNTGAFAINDTFFVVSDQFDPSLAGPVGVGIIGSFVNAGAPLGGPVAGAVQAEMNFLTTGLITNALFGAPLAGFFLDTPQPFVNCVACSPIGFWAANFGVGPGGVEQLIGAINFQLAPGSSIVMPGSMIITDNDNSAITSELPEPATNVLLGSALIGLAALRRRVRA